MSVEEEDELPADSSLACATLSATMAGRAETLTFLFTDLVSSTELLQRAGDEAAQRIFATHHDLLSQAVAAHGGSEVQWLGDGLMVTFGSASDALRCAIAMQQAARRPAAGKRLDIRVGLHAGDAMRSGKDYFGTPIVIARRLCDRAVAGQILTSEALLSMVPDRSPFTLEPLGAMELKGLSETIAAVDVRYSHDPAAFLTHTPFVGREAESAVLRAKLDYARAGKGSVVMLVGEPGIGKTRTIEEFAAHARSQGARVLRGRCYDGEWAPPFSPFVEALRDYARETSAGELASALGADAGVLARIVPQVREFLPDVPEPPALQAEGERYRLLDAVADVLSRIAVARPLVLVLDDLHWADKGAIAMLRHVARSAGAKPVLILGAYRDVELDRQHPLAAALADLRREASFERIPLKGLATEEVGELLDVIAEQDVPRPLVDAIAAETNGNPFFIKEVLLHLVEERKIVQEDGRWTSALSIAEMGIPEGVREVIGRRLSRLGDACNRMLTAASAMTGGFSWAELRAICEEPERPLLDALDEALRAQVLLEVSGAAATYDFTHALIRHTLYEELSTPRRLLLHRRIGEALESLYATDIESHLAELAHHFFESGQPSLADKGIDYACRAAELAERVGAHDEAAALYERSIQASELHGVRDDAARCELMLAFARAQFRTGVFGSENTDIYLRVAALAKRAGLTELCARAAACEGRVWPVLDKRLAPVLEDALAALVGADSVVRARALGYLGLLLGDEDNLRARAMTREAIQVARRIEDARTEAYVLTWHFLVINRFDSPSGYESWDKETKEVVVALLASADASNDPEMQRAAHFTAMLYAGNDGNVGAVRHHLEEHEALSTRSRVPQDMHATSYARAALALFVGGHHEAEALIEEAGTFADRVPRVAWFHLIQLYMLHLQQGRLPEFRTLLPALCGAEPRARVFAAHFASEIGDIAGARGELEHVIAAFDADAADDGELIMLLVPDVCHLLRDQACAERLYHDLFPWRAINLGFGAVTYTGSAFRQLGVLAETIGRYDDAARHFEDALAMNMRMGARPWVARTQLDYGRMLLKHDAAGDREHARGLLDAALALAKEIGMAKVAADCEALLAQP